MEDYIIYEINIRIYKYTVNENILDLILQICETE